MRGIIAESREVPLDDCPPSVQFMVQAVGMIYRRTQFVMAHIMASKQRELIFCPQPATDDQTQVTEIMSGLMVGLARCGVDWVAMACEAWSIYIARGENESVEEHIARVRATGPVKDLGERQEVVSIVVSEPQRDWSAMAPIIREGDAPARLGRWCIWDCTGASEGKFAAIWGKASDAEKQELLTRLGCSPSVN